MCLKESLFWATFYFCRIKQLLFGAEIFSSAQSSSSSWVLAKYCEEILCMLSPKLLKWSKANYFDHKLCKCVAWPQEVEVSLLLYLTPKLSLPQQSKHMESLGQFKHDLKRNTDGVKRSFRETMNGLLWSAPIISDGKKHCLRKQTTANPNVALLMEQL